MSARILVVDDDPTIVRLLTLNLEMEGYEVAAASNGREALDQLAAAKPDLLLCDVMMPVMNGLEVVARLRRDPATAGIPVIMLSAKAQDMDVKHGRGAGADEYVTKPFDPGELIEVIERVLKRASAPEPAAKEAHKTARPRAKPGK